jgi:hypothetical protein
MALVLGRFAHRQAGNRLSRTLPKTCDVGAGLVNSLAMLGLQKLEQLGWAVVHVGKSLTNQEIP